MNKAQLILTTGQGQPDRVQQQHRHAEFIANSFEWIGRDMALYTFRDGSQLLFTLDENLHGVEAVLI